MTSIQNTDLFAITGQKYIYTKNFQHFQQKYFVLIIVYKHMNVNNF